MLPLLTATACRDFVGSLAAQGRVIEFSAHPTRIITNVIMRGKLTVLSRQARRTNSTVMLDTIPIRAAASPADPAAVEQREQHWITLATTLWIMMFVAHAVKTFLNPNEHSVYLPFATGARNWWSETSVYSMTGFYYGPTFAVLFSPFALLPDWLGCVLWSGLSIGTLVYSLRVFFREVLQPMRPTASLGPFLLLSSVGSLHGIWSAQNNAMVVALVLLAAAALVRSRYWRAAFLLALPVHIKVWPLAAGALLSTRWPVRLAPRLAVGVLALALVPFLTKQPAVVVACYAEWSDALAYRQSHHVRFPGLRDAWTVWEQIHSPVNPRAYAVLQATSGLAVLGWCLWQIRRRPPTRVLLFSIVAMWAAWQLIFGPGTERLTYGIIAPMTTWALLTSYAERRGRALAALAWLMTGPLSFGEIEKPLLAFVPQLVVTMPIGAAAFACWLVMHERGLASAESEPMSHEFLGRVRMTELLPDVWLPSHRQAARKRAA
jgi:hypothetical protein